MYKTLISAKPLGFMFDKVNGFTRVYDKTKYLILFGLEKYDAIYNRIRYLRSLKCGITYVFSRNYAKIKIDSDDGLSLEKTLSLHNVIIHIKSVLNKNKNHYYYKIFLEKYLYQLAKKYWQKLF